MRSLPLLLAALLGCSAGATDEGPQLTVLAAASLTEAMTELGDAFEEDRPGWSVRLGFAGSQQLAGQIADGAPADVFASADRRQVDRLVEDGMVEGDPVVFAGNRLVIAVESGNPLGITDLEDLGRPDLVVVLAADEVPAGRYAQAALDLAGVQVTPDSLEADVRTVLSRVALGEADAGIVYASDLRPGTGVEAVPIPGRHQVEIDYWAAVLAQAPDADGARAFLELLLSPRGEGILERHGFRGP